MTIGSTLTDRGSKSNTFVYYYLGYGGAEIGEYQGSSVIPKFVSRVWSGTDRGALAPRTPPGVWRYYTVPVKVKTKNGRIRTVVEKRRFRDRPALNRVNRNLNNAPHPYSVTIEKVFDEKFVVRQGSPAAYHKLEQSVTRVSGWPLWAGKSDAPVISSNDQIKLVGKLKEQMRGSDFNLAVFLGEGREALSMISSTAIKLARAGIAARKGRFADASRILMDGKRAPKGSQQAASSWLELQYGWLPLLSDMKSGAECLAHILHAPKMKSYRVRVKHRATYVPSQYEWNFKVAERTASRSLVAYISEPESTLSVSGLLDPELVAWELLPFSFVADWFIPLGDYLDARAFARRLTGTFVTTDFIRETSSVILGQAQTDWTSIAESNSVFRESIWESRSVSTSLDVPMPNVKTFKQIASWQHMANALALAVQVFKGAPLRDLSRHSLLQ